MEPGQPKSGLRQKPTEQIKDLRNGSAPQPANFGKDTRNMLNKGQPPEQNVLRELDSHMQEIKNRSPIYYLTLYKTHSKMSEILMRAKTETMGRKHGNNVSKHWLCIASGNKTLGLGNKSIGFLILALQANYGTRSSTCNTHSHVMKKRGNAEGCPVTSLFCQVRKSLEKKTNSLFFLSQKSFKILYHHIAIVHINEFIVVFRYCVCRVQT